MSLDLSDTASDPRRLDAIAALGLAPGAADETLDRFARIARYAIGAPVALVSLVTDELQFFPGCVGLEGEAGEHRQTPISHSFCRHVVSSQAPVIITDAREDPRVRSNPAIEDLGVIAYLGIPLTSPTGLVVGSFCVIDQEPREWTAAEVDVMTDLSEVVMTELRLRHTLDERTELISQAETQRDRAHALLAFADAIAAAPGAREVAEVVATKASEVVGAIFSYMGFVGDDPQTLIVHHGAAMDDAHREQFSQIPIDDSTAMGSAALTRDIVWVVGADELRRRFPTSFSAAEQMGLTTAAALPTPGMPGVVGVGWDRSVPPSNEMVDTLRTVAAMCAQALARAMTFDRRREVAERLQRSLLPDSLPEVDGHDLEAVYLPAVADIEVGGDWYDVIHRESGRVVLALGDVVGKGVDAAAAMGRVRTALDTLVNQPLSLQEVAAGLDRFAAGEPGVRDGTIALLELDPGTAEVEYINLGHLPVFVCRSSTCSVERIWTPLPPVGFDSTTVRAPVRFVLEPGDSLVAFTDGLVERRGESIDDGLARLERKLTDQLESRQPALRNLVRGLPAINPSGSDDIALLALRRDR